MPIKKLEISNVGLFQNIKFDFDSRVNVFVGPNNCGKTTALCAIADIAVHPFTFPPKHIRKNSGFRADFLTDLSKHLVVAGELPIAVSEKGYWTEKRTAGLKALQKQMGYTTYIPALRLGTDFRSKGPTIENEKKDSSQPSMLRRADLAAIMAYGKDAAKTGLFEAGYSFITDESIIQDIINFDYQSYREKKPAIRKTIEQIASIGSRITEGFPVEFAGVDEDAGGLFPCFKTPDGNMPLNVLSQGTQGLLLWLSRFIIGYARYYHFPKSFVDKPGVLIIDEIDAHLHPSWQRRVIPEITTAFPNLQIFCSTHSPLMIAGLKSGQVQLLQRDKSGKVCVSQNDKDILGWSADEIYSCFLGIENPTDLKTDNQIERLEILRGKKKLSPAEKRELNQLREHVGSALQNTPSFETTVTELAQSLRKAADASIPKPTRVRANSKS